MAGHLGLRIVRLGPDEIGKVGEVMTVVDEPDDMLRLVLEDEDG